MQGQPPSPIGRTVMLTTVALLAFAANSVLSRLALGQQALDAASFTEIRLLSGAVVLYVLLSVRTKRWTYPAAGSWSATLMLFIYAGTFSYAYNTLETGTGALILFGAVQMTMILLTLMAGNRLHGMEWLGVTMAFSGFVYLVLPGVGAPSWSGFLLMAVAGVAWGIYTLKGRDSKQPLQETTGNFVRTLPLLAVLAIVAIGQAHYSVKGVLLAVLSGGIASGIGYAIWYMALAGLSSALAAVVQLLVPVIAALGGVVFVSEAVSLRLLVSAGLILGGILAVVLGKTWSAGKKQYAGE